MLVVGISPCAGRPFDCLLGCQRRCRGRGLLLDGRRESRHEERVLGDAERLGKNLQRGRGHCLLK
eukprot:7335023-Pyramimonas_sp.AAC.1